MWDWIKRLLPADEAPFGTQPPTPSPTATEETAVPSKGPTPDSLSDSKAADWFEMGTHPSAHASAPAVSGACDGFVSMGSPFSECGVAEVAVRSSSAAPSTEVLSCATSPPMGATDAVDVVMGERCADSLETRASTDGTDQCEQQTQEVRRRVVPRAATGARARSANTEALGSCCSTETTPATSKPGGPRFRDSIIGGVSFHIPERYTVKCLVGKGAYGMVCAAEDAEPTEGPPSPSTRMVAVKKIIEPFQDRTDCKRLLREIRLLRLLRHPNVLHLNDLLPPVSLSPNAWTDVYLVTRLFDTNLHRVIYSGQPLSDAHIQYILWQVFRALRYMHAAGVVHRDMKPTNILLNRDCELALADLGLARHMQPNVGSGSRQSLANSPYPERMATGHLTKYVVTRWYRAPELLVQNQRYTTAVDMWSIGCILAEVLGAKALFPGKDSLHQLRLIFDKLGAPSQQELRLIENEQAAKFVAGLRPKHKEPTGAVAYASLFPTAPPTLIDLLCSLLRFDPSKRLTAEEALKHPYLEAYHEAPEDDVPIPHIEMGFEGQNPTKERLRELVWEEVLLFHPALRNSPHRH